MLAGLLVSVRSAHEARDALAGGASVVDVKEPDRGPLGCAEPQVWREVRAVVPPTVPVSVALGELSEWDRGARRAPTPEQFEGLTYRKLGLAGAGDSDDWRRHWDDLRRAWGPGPSWIAVVYADWERARAPHPDSILAAAQAADDCAGILIDTWDKSRPSPLWACARTTLSNPCSILGRVAGVSSSRPQPPPDSEMARLILAQALSIDPVWGGWIARARQGRPLLITLAGGLDSMAIVRLAPLGPDLFAVRGAACDTGDRRAGIDPRRVARLARLAAAVQSAGAATHWTASTMTWPSVP